MAMKMSVRNLAAMRLTTQLSSRLPQKSLAFPVLKTSGFHTSRPSRLVLGEKLPPHSLMEKSPSDRIDLQKELASGKSIIIGTPAAFSGTCSQSHLPGFFSRLAEFKKKGIQNFFVISVNDPFVMNAWKDSFGTDSSVRFLSDPQGEWAKAARVDWDATTILGNRRSKRFVAVVDNGVVSAIFIEPDNTGLTITSADSVLTAI